MGRTMHSTSNKQEGCLEHASPAYACWNRAAGSGNMLQLASVLMCTCCRIWHRVLTSFGGSLCTPRHPPFKKILVAWVITHALFIKILSRKLLQEFHDRLAGAAHTDVTVAHERHVLPCHCPTAFDYKAARVSKFADCFSNK